MLTRLITQTVLADLATTPAVALLGARQVGKTTLAKSLASTDSIAIDTPPLYLDLEDSTDRLKLSDTKAFLTTHNHRLVILDEVQYMPDIFMALRGLIDTARQGGRESGQFLLLGSASMAVRRGVAESLAGRISHIDMGGLNIFEVGAENAYRLWLRGGFPNNYLAHSDRLAMRRLESLIRTYLERDIPQLGLSIPAARLRQLWVMLAHLQGTVADASKLASNLGVDAKTIRRYIDILCELFLLRRLPPWHSNTKKRLVKAPRYYVRDTGLLHRLLGIGSMDALLAHPVVGKSWEGFVIENICSVLPRLAAVHFYRTQAGAEIDLVITMPDGACWAVEIKRGLTPQWSKHYSRIADDIGASHKYIVYGGDDEFSVGEGVVVLSLARILGRIMHSAQEYHQWYATSGTGVRVSHDIDTGVWCW